MYFRNGNVLAGLLCLDQDRIPRELKVQCEIKFGPLNALLLIKRLTF